MKVLIDGRAFFNDGSSISVYLYNLSKNLFKLNNLEYVLVLNNKKYIKEFSKYKNVKIIFSNIKNNLIWDNIVIPFYSLKYKCNLIFYPKGSSCMYKIPSKKIVVTIHGMIYKKHPEVHSFIENIYWRFIGKVSSIISNKIIVVSESDKKDLLSGIDTYILEKVVFNRILGISNVRQSSRISFIGGIRGLKGIREKADYHNGVGFSVFPPTMSEIMNISDAGEVMPPKSTWFEPKLRDGLLTHMI